VAGSADQNLPLAYLSMYPYQPSQKSRLVRERRPIR